ncbi:hypothetical protein [Parasphingorhabdus pacifica]
MARPKPVPPPVTNTVRTLTSAGHELVEQLVDRVLMREAELISGPTADQQAALSELLRVFLDDLQTHLGEQPPTHVGSV